MLPPFQARVYESPAAARMSELVSREGNLQALLALRKGEASAQMAQQLGAIGANSMAQLASYKLDQPRRELEAAKAQEAQRQLSDARNQRGLSQMAGAVGLTRTQTADLFEREGFRDQADVIRANALKLEAAKKELAVSTAKILGGLARGVVASGYDPDAFKQSAAALVQMGALTETDVASALERLKKAEDQDFQQSDPTRSGARAVAKQITTEIAGQIAPFVKDDELKPIGARGLYDPRTGQIIGAPAEKPGKPLSAEDRYNLARERGDKAGMQAALADVRALANAGRKPDTGGAGGSEISQGGKAVADRTYTATLRSAQTKYNKGLKALTEQYGDPKTLTGEGGMAWTKAHAELLETLRNDQREATDHYRYQIGEAPTTDEEWDAMVEKTRGAAAGKKPAPAASTSRSMAALAPGANQSVASPIDFARARPSAAPASSAPAASSVATPSAVELEAAQLLSALRANPTGPQAGAQRARLRELRTLIAAQAAQ